MMDLEQIKKDNPSNLIGGHIDSEREKKEEPIPILRQILKADSIFQWEKAN